MKRICSPQSLVLRPARGQARAKSAKDGGLHLIDPPLCGLGPREALARAGTVNNDVQCNRFWFLLDYEKGGLALQSQMLLDLIEAEQPPRIGGPWLEVSQGGPANFTRRGKAFLPLNSACPHYSPFSLAFGATKPIERTPCHIGLDKEASIYEHTKWLELENKDVTLHDAFLDLLAEINHTAKPGKSVPAARARGVKVDGDALVVDGFTAKLVQDGEGQLWTAGP